MEAAATVMDKATELTKSVKSGEFALGLKKKDEGQAMEDIVIEPKHWRAAQQAGDQPWFHVQEREEQERKK